MEKFQPYKFVGILVFLLLSYLYINFPIYPDEITNQYLSSKSSEFNGYKVWLIESCNLNKDKLNLIINIINEIYSYPFNIIKNNYNFRLFNIFLGGFLYFLIIKLLFKNDKGDLFLLLLLSWPINYINTFIIIRPEYYILLLLILNISYYISKKNIILISIVLSYIFAINQHPKVIYYLPLILINLLYFSGNKISKTIKYFILIFFVYITYIYYKLYLEIYATCIYDYVNNIFQNYQVSPLLLFQNPLLFFEKLIKANDFLRIDRSLSQIILKNNYDIGYLPNIIKYENIAFCINFIYVGLLLYFFKNYIKLNINLFTSIYTLTILLVFLLNANKATYDVFLLINSLILIRMLSKREDQNL